MPFTSWKEYQKGEHVSYSSRNSENEIEITEEFLLGIKGVGPKIAEKIMSQLPVTSVDEIEAPKNILKAIHMALSD